MIEIKNLHKSFDGKEVLKGITSTFDSGKTNLIIGQSGSGKTVLIKNIVGLFEPTEGDVLYDGRSFMQMTKRERAMLRREMGMIFQNAALFDSMSVLENVMFPLDMFSNDSYKERVRRAQFCLDRVNLTDAGAKYPGEISGGMQKRVAIARALVKRPRILLCDEPTGALDSETGKRILKLLKETAKENKISLIVVTHNANLEKIADQVIRLKDGKIQSCLMNEHPMSIDEVEW